MPDFDDPTGHCLLYFLIFLVGIVGKWTGMSEAHDIIVASMAGLISNIAMMAALHAPSREKRSGKRNARKREGEKK